MDVMQEVWSAISRNKLRTALTGFAVAWGIFILIVLLGAGNGLIHAFEENSSAVALNSVKVYSGWTAIPYDGLEKGRMISFKNRDLELTKQRFAGVVGEVSANLYAKSQTVSYGREYISASLCGYMPARKLIDGAKIVEGRYINELDMEQMRKVAVITDKSSEVLFKGEDPIGKFIDVGHVAFKVVGVAEADRNSASHEVTVPFTTLQIIYDLGDEFDSYAMTVNNLSSEAENDRFTGELRDMLAELHRFSPDDDGAVYVWSQFKNYLRTLTAMNLLTTALWVIGIFTLISGVVGVSNIMLITVKERTREFGIRKALGARPRQILVLVMVESIVITTFFGYIGMVVGVGVTELASSILEVSMSDSSVFTNPTVDLSTAFSATFTLIVAGTVAGFIPARRAVSIRPIEALRAD